MLWLNECFCSTFFFFFFCFQGWLVGWLVGWTQLPKTTKEYSVNSGSMSLQDLGASAAKCTQCYHE